MGTISGFLIQNITLVFFFYGLAFYSMGLVLIVTGRRTSKFRLAQAIRPLAYFAILHGTNEWMDMVQRIAELEIGLIVPSWYKWIQLAILVASFLMLLVFDLVLLSPHTITYHKIGSSVMLMLAFWTANVLLVTVVYQLNLSEILAVGDTLARYLLAIPASLFGAWALFKQRNTLRQHQMPQFGRDLMISAMALLAYGALGQVFVGKTFLFPSNYINNQIFLNLFGVPIQLFRGGVATIIAIYIARALNVFEMESQRKLAAAQQEKLQTQRAAIQTERRINREKNQLNEELSLKTQELSVLLNVSNMLAVPIEPQEQSREVLQHIVNSLLFPDAGILILKERQTENVSVDAVVGFSDSNDIDRDTPYATAKLLGQLCVEKELSICRHADGQQIVFNSQKAREWGSCQNVIAPVVMLGIPLVTQNEIIGALVLAQTGKPSRHNLSVNEFNLVLGISQQLGLSIENARLHQEAQRHEKVLSELLHRVVGAQESERKRIARELHDATGQSLTAIGLGLRGAEMLIARHPEMAISHLQQLKQYSTTALGELRRIIANLRPSQLDDLGLDAALRWYAKRFQKHYNVSVRLEIHYSAASLPPDSETTVFRITQEALANVAKHADAESAGVRLTEFRNYIELLVVDDGAGFYPSDVLRGNGSKKGWGLLGIQERAQLLGGTCRIESSPGQGTRVQVTIPKKYKGEQNVENKITAG